MFAQIIIISIWYTQCQIYIKIHVKRKNFMNAI